MIEAGAEIRISGAEPEITDAMRERLTFTNPRWASAASAGRSTHGIPQYLSAYKDEPGVLVVPGGLLDKVHELLPGWRFVDRRQSVPVRLPALAGIRLRDYQLPAVKAATNHQQATIVAPTGAGKTIIGLSILAEWGQRALILVHNKELANQWREEIRKLMGIEAGTIGGGKWDEGALITVAMLQTLSRNQDRAESLAYGALLVDEAHHIPSASFADVSMALNVRHRLGLTATPTRRDGLGELVGYHLGPIRAEIQAEDVRAAGGIVPVTVQRIEFPMEFPFLNGWGEYLDAITQDVGRNRFLADMAERAAHRGATLVLTDRTSHAEALGELLPGALVLYGSLPARERRERFERINDARLVIGTTGLLGEGLDIKGLTNLILATPISSRAKLLQAVGRVIRSKENKERCYVADIFEPHGLSISSHRKRLTVYQEQGWRVVG